MHYPEDKKLSSSTSHQMFIAADEYASLDVFKASDKGKLKKKKKPDISS